MTGSMIPAPGGWLTRPCVSDSGIGAPASGRLRRERSAAASNDLIIRDLYALSNNDARKFADWVCTYMTYHEVVGVPGKYVTEAKAGRQEPILATDVSAKLSQSKSRTRVTVYLM